MKAKYLETTIRIFRTMCKTAKQNSLCTDITVDDMKLQKLKSLDRVLH